MELPPGRKLETISWKTFDLWTQHRPMRPGEEPEEHWYSERSLFGIFQGDVIIKESKAGTEK